MDDHRASGQPGEIQKNRPSPLGKAQDLARRGGRRLTGLIRRTADLAGDELRHRLIQLLETPEHVETLQAALATVANWALSQGFRADPNAHLLFDFVTWLEERHGRARITTLLVTSDLLRDPAFLEGLSQVSRTLSPLPLPAHQPWSPDEMRAFKERGGRRMMALLVQLAALESDEPPPAAGQADRIAYFESAPIPRRFRRLARMTHGERLLERRVSRRRRALRRLKARVPEAPTDLVPYQPGRADETLHFLVFSTTFFLQSYLLRGLVESLPTIADELATTLDPDAPLDIGE